MKCEEDKDRIKKALYGLKQAPMISECMIVSYFMKKNFLNAPWACGLYEETKKRKILIYVLMWWFVVHEIAKRCLKNSIKLCSKNKNDGCELMPFFSWHRSIENA